MGSPGKRSGGSAAVVLLFVLLVADMAPLGTALMQGPRAEAGPAAQRDITNDPSTKTVGNPAYYASFVSMAGFGTPRGKADELLPVDMDGDSLPELATMTAQGFVEVLDPPSYKVIWRSPQLTDGVHTLVAGDLDGDGHEEIVVGDGYGQVYVYSRAYIKDPLAPPMAIGRLNERVPVHAMALVDFDNDGQQDVLCSPEGTNNLTYLRNSLSGDGKHLVLTLNLSSSMGPYVGWGYDVSILRAGDMTGSGDVQLLVAFTDHEGGSAIMRLNRTTFAALWTHYGYGFTVFDMVVRDIDNDTYPEVVMRRGNVITIFNATNFDEKWHIDWQGWWFDAVSLGDLNGDGLVEMFLIEEDPDGKIHFTLFNVTAQSGIFSARLDWKEYPVGIAIGDLDGDNGLPEVAVTLMANMTIMSMEPSGGRNYTVEKVVQNIGYEAYGLDGLDWDGDGITELVSGSNEGLLSVIDPLTGAIEGQRSAIPNSQASVTVADLDKDGQQEILTGNLKNITMLAQNLTVKAYNDLMYYSGSNWNSHMRAPMTVGDIDHDGSLEVIVGTESGTLHSFNGANMSAEDGYYGGQGKDRAILATDIDMDGYPEIVTGDTNGHLAIIAGPKMHGVTDQFYDYGPYGLAAGDVEGDGWPELLVGSYNGYVRALKGFLLIQNLSSEDLGYQTWGLTCADVDGDGTQEVMVGTGDGYLMALNITDLSIKWSVHLGEWIGLYDSIIVRDLDKDGKLEVAVGSDGYVYILRLLTPSQTPDISLGAITTPEPLVDGRDVVVSVPVKLTGPVAALNVTVDIWIEPTGSGTLGGQDLGRVTVRATSTPTTVSLNWTPSNGTWLIVAQADPDNNYSDRDEQNDRAERKVVVMSKFVHLEWFAGQGTNLGRYHSMAVADTDNDGRPELVVGGSEGFVQSYTVEKMANGSGKDDMSAVAMSDDLGSNPFGIAVGDLDRDGSAEVVVSNGDGWVFAFKGVGKDLEWKAKVSDGPCYGLLAADTDSDGAMEVVAGCSDGWVHVLDGKDGRSEGKTMLLFEVYALALADVGDDGKPDLLAAAQDGTVYVLAAKTMETETSFRLGDVYVDDLTAGDVDHDGGTEIVYGDRSGEVYVVGTVTNPNAPASWDLALECSVSTGSAVRRVGLVDISRDPGLELVVGSIDGIAAFRARDGGLEPIGGLTMGGGLTGFALGDLDKDGAFEAALGTVTGNITVLGIGATYQGNITMIDFTTKAHLPGLGAGLYGVAYGDIDQDGAPELLLGTEAGDLRVYDGISKELKAHASGMGASLYGLKVADVNDDGTPEIVAGSGDKRLCTYSYGAGAISKLWCSDDFGDWTIAFQVLDANKDGKTEVAVGSGSKVYLLNGTTGKTMNSTFELGPHIISLAAGELDGDPWPELVAGTEMGYLTVINANNMTMAWGVTLDSWPAGLAIADTDGDGLGEIYAGTNTAVYSISLKDREVSWEHDLGEPAWGLTVTDLQADGRLAVMAGLKDGRLMALDASTGKPFWYSASLGSRAGWYNSIRAGDMDVDSQNELLVGSSGFLYLFGAGDAAPRPVPDAALEGMAIQDQELADGQTTNVTATVYDHSLAPMVNLTVHLFVDDVYSDSAVIAYMAPLERVSVTFSYTARAGTHNLSVEVDRYDTVHEYNEKNNNRTIVVIVLGAMNLAVEGGAKGVRFSDKPVKGVELTVFADIRNTGEEASSAKIKFYWANLRLFGEDTVRVRGQEKVTAAVNWTLPEAGDWDVTVIIEPDGFDSNKDDNAATRTIHVMTHPSVALVRATFPTDMVEEMLYVVPVQLNNGGEAGTTGRLAVYIDGNLSWTSGALVLPAGGLLVAAGFNATAGAHGVRFALEGLGLDDRTYDNELVMNVTIRTRPDLLFDAVMPPAEGMVVAGKQLFIGLLIANRGGSNGTFVVRAYDNDQIFFEQPVELDAGTSRTVQVPWNVTKGDHNLMFRIEGTVPSEFRTGNNVARLSLYAPEKKVATTNWPMASLLFVGVLAPLIAVLAYYSQVQPVREAARLAREARVRPRPVKKAVKKVKHKGA
jgi:subtilase family serine protease